jgi:hypothetical protein
VLSVIPDIEQTPIYLRLVSRWRLSSLKKFDKRRPHVRFGSKADMCNALAHVRFTPDSDHESGHVPMVMSALPLKADMCGAYHHVCFGP